MTSAQRKCILGDIRNQWNIPVAGIQLICQAGDLTKIGLSASYAHWKCSFPKDRPCQGMGKRHDKLPCFLDCYHEQSKEEHSGSETSVVCDADFVCATVCPLPCTTPPMEWHCRCL